MTDRVEGIIDNVNIVEEVEDAIEAFSEAIKEYSLPRRAAFFGCIHILMRYGDQKKWTAAELKEVIGKYIDLHLMKKDEENDKSVKSFNRFFDEISNFNPKGSSWLDVNT